MRLNSQLNLIPILEDKCRELELENKSLKRFIQEERDGGIVYIPFPEKKGLLNLIANWFKVRPLETMTVVHSYWVPIMIDVEKKWACPNCNDIFEGNVFKRYAYCPTCAAMMDLNSKGENNV